MALLRGINVGGKSAKMVDVVSVCKSLGLTEVQTYLQSGNIIFESSATNQQTAKSFEASLKKRLGFETRVILRSAAELRRLIASNPFRAEAARDPSHLVVMFLERRPENKAKSELLHNHSGPEKMHFKAQEAYIYYPNGIGPSKLTNAFLERKLGLSGTARNWNTITALSRLTAVDA